MIHPRLATMLAVVTTDYPLEPGEPAQFLRAAVDASFNRISVDGECSTNDAVVAARERRERSRANGRRATSGSRLRSARSATTLAREIVADGEGSTVLLEIAVSGAASNEEAEAVARRIATSPLVKTAAFGRDPNWGRVLAAAGSAPWNGGFAHVDADRLTRLVRRGAGLRAWRADRREARARRPAVADRPRPGARRRERLVPRVRSDVRLRAAERGVHDLMRVVVKLGGRVAQRLGRARPRAARGRRRGRRRPRRRPADHRGAADARGCRPVRRRPPLHRSGDHRRRAQLAGRRRRRAVRRARPCGAPPRRRRDRARGGARSRPRPRRRAAAVPAGRGRGCARGSADPGRRRRSPSGRSTSTRTRRRPRSPSGSRPSGSSSSRTCRACSSRAPLRRGCTWTTRTSCSTRARSTAESSRSSSPPRGRPGSASPPRSGRRRWSRERASDTVSQGLDRLLPTYARADLTIVRGDGCRVWDADGREYLDFGGGIAVVSLGHCHPAPLAAAHAQLDRLWHVSNLYRTEPAEELAALLSARFGGAQAFFCNSGAEAVEAALKYARKATAKPGVVALDGSFHGRTLGALSATGQPGKRAAFEPLVPGRALRSAERRRGARARPSTTRRA